MSRAYLLLIGALAILALGIGAFAYFRSAKNPAQFSPSISTPFRPSQPTTPSQPANEQPLQNQITLAVSSPTSGQQVNSASLVVRGKTAPNADVAVNDQDVKADASGNFQATVNLDEGDNEIFVTASDTTGNVSEWSTTVTYTPAQ